MYLCLCLWNESKARVRAPHLVHSTSSVSSLAGAMKGSVARAAWLMLGTGSSCRIQGYPHGGCASRCRRAKQHSQAVPVWEGSVDQFRLLITSKQKYSKIQFGKIIHTEKVNKIKITENTDFGRFNKSSCVMLPGPGPTSTICESRKFPAAPMNLNSTIKDKILKK